MGGLVVTNDVSLSLAPGARHALIGPNGAGKTTLINLVTGRLLPRGGTVRLDGQDVTALPQHRRTRLGTIAGRVRMQGGTVSPRGSALGSLPPSAQCRAGIGLVPQDLKLRLGVETVVATYRGTASALNDVMGGQVSLTMSPLLAVTPNLGSGRLRAFGVTAPARSSLAPETPTLAEGGLPDVEQIVWYGMWGPKGLPAETVARLNASSRQVAEEPDFVRRLTELGCGPVVEDAAGFSRRIEADHSRNTEIIADARIEPE